MIKGFWNRVAELHCAVHAGSFRVGVLGGWPTYEAGISFLNFQYLRYVGVLTIRVCFGVRKIYGWELTIVSSELIVAQRNFEQYIGKASKILARNEALKIVVVYHSVSLV